MEVHSFTKCNTIEHKTSHPAQQRPLWLLHIAAANSVTDVGTDVSGHSAGVHRYGVYLLCS